MRAKIYAEGKKMKDTFKINNKGTKMIAHRGASGLETENTCAAFVAAANRSYYGIETDVHVTSDGKFIIMHDDNLSRVAGENMVVEECTFDTLRNVILFNKDGKKSRKDLIPPSLDEYITICRDYGKVSVLELKNPMKKEDIFAIIERVKQLGHFENTIFISFAYENLLCVKEYDANAKAQFLCGADFSGHYEEMLRLGIGADVYDCVTEEFVKKLHNDGMELNVWTIDDPARAEVLSSLGVDYITTDIVE